MVFEGRVNRRARREYDSLERAAAREVERRTIVTVGALYVLHEYPAHALNAAYLTRSREVAVDHLAVLPPKTCRS